MSAQTSNFKLIINHSNEVAAETVSRKTNIEADGFADEFVKDIWDVRRLSFLQPRIGRSAFHLSFVNTPESFRVCVKRWAKRSLIHSTFDTVYSSVRYLNFFLNFYRNRHPAAKDLSDLGRSDIEAYLMHVRVSPMPSGASPSDNHIWYSISAVKKYVVYLEQVNDPDKPALTVLQLIWPGDVQRKQWRDNAGPRLKHVPDFVLQQLDRDLPEMEPTLFTIISIIRATGWRISDTLNLRYDKCLLRTYSTKGELEWWLRGDIPKTKVKNLQVPLTEELAAVVTARIEWVKKHIPEETNPQRYLFPSTFKGAHGNHREGSMLTAAPIQRRLRSFCRKHNICDEQGRLYDITTRGLRHARAVEYINNGMSLVSIQKMYGHVSSEMTQTYAQILDPTVRQEWAAAMRKGAVKAVADGPPVFFDPLQDTAPDQIEWEHIRHSLDAIRLPNGFCFKPNKLAPCPTQPIPCHVCPSFCTTPDFLPQFQKQKEDMLIQIEIGRRQGQKQWVERNQQNLDNLEPIINLLETGRLHHPAGKKSREYTPAEREKRTAEAQEGGADDGQED